MIENPVKEKEEQINSKSNLQHRLSFKSITDSISSDDNLIVKGYIATTHFDGQDIITKSALQKWADEINLGNPRSNKVSVNHQRIPHVAGVGIKGTARVDKLSDGEFGLYVETIVDKTREDYNEIKYRIEHNLLDSFSIEYVAPETPLLDKMSGARILDESTELHGWTLASQPMNEHAIMIKELVTISSDNKPKQEEKKMSDNIQVKESLSAEDAKLLQEAKEKKLSEMRDIELKQLKEKIMTEIKESLKSAEVQEKSKINNANLEIKELTAYKEALKSKSFDVQLKEASRLAEKLGLISANGCKVDSKDVFSRQYKFTTDGNKMQYKGLGITTNQNTDTDYLLSAAELADVFDPVIYNGLNEVTTTWNLLAKDDFSNKGSNQVQFTIKTTANTTASAYLGNAVALGNTGRKKYLTKFKKYQVGIEVDGDMIAAARGGPISDVFAQEVKDATETLLSIMNIALFAEVGLESAAGVIGFEYITDSAGNATLYNITRSTDSFLAPTSAASTYINGSSAIISLTNLRAAKRQAVSAEGANLNNLVFVTSFTQGDMFRSLYDAAQRLVPTSSRFGFQGRPEFDGIPVFEDKDCNSDDWFLVDLETHRIAMWVPPTLEMLGKDADSQKGFIKCYWCTYNRRPNRMVQIYGNATS